MPGVRREAFKTKYGAEARNTELAEEVRSLTSMLETAKAAAAQLVDSKLSHVLKSVDLIVERLEGKVPLIGFSAAY